MTNVTVKKPWLTLADVSNFARAFIWVTLFGCFAFLVTSLIFGEWPPMVIITELAKLVLSSATIVASGELIINKWYTYER